MTANIRALASAIQTGANALVRQTHEDGEVIFNSATGKSESIRRLRSALRELEKELNAYYAPQADFKI